MAASESRRARGVALGDYLQMLWQSRWLVLAAVVAATALAVATRPPEPVPFYRATVTLRVQVFGFSASGSSAIVQLQGVPPAEVEAARSVEVAAQTARELGMTDGGTDLLNRLAVTTQDNTDLMQLTLTGQGLDTVHELEMYAANYEDFRNEQQQELLTRAVDQVDASIEALEPRLAQLSAKYATEDADGAPSQETLTRLTSVSSLYNDLVSRRELLKLDAALAGQAIEVIGSPIPQRLGAIPARTLRVIAGPIVGLLIGCAVAIALGVLRPRVTGWERAEERFGYPVLAAVPRVKTRNLTRDPLLLRRTSGWAAEAMRMLRTELQLIEEHGRKLGCVAVVSGQPRDGKSTVAVNLAATYTEAGRKVVLVHADLHARHAQRSGPGLTDYTSGRVKAPPVRRVRGGFYEVPVGPSLKGSEESSQQRLIEGIESLKREYDLVIVDTPPLLAFADALRIASEADAVVVIARHGKTLEARVDEALDVLIRHDAAVAGLVLNDAPVGRMQRLRYRHYYGEPFEGEVAPDGLEPHGDRAADTAGARDAVVSPLPPPAPVRGEKRRREGRR